MTYCLMTKRKDGKMKKRRNVLTNAGGGGAFLNPLFYGLKTAFYTNYWCSRGYNLTNFKG